MRARGNLRALLLLLLLGAVPMEALFLFRQSLIRLVHDAYPHVVMDREGEMNYYDWEQVEQDGRWTHVSYRLDAERRAIDSMAPPLDVAVGAWGWSYGPRPSLEPRFLRHQTPRVQRGVLLILANILNTREAQRRDLKPPAMVVAIGGEALEKLKPMPLHWQPEEGRLVCRETATGRVLAGIGPDGYERGEAAAEGESFSNVGPYLVLGRYDGVWPGFGILEGERRIVALVAPATPAPLPPDSVEPMELVVEQRPLHSPDASPEWTESPWIARTGDDMLILHVDGSLVGRIRLEPGESVLGTAGDRSSGAQMVLSSPGGASVRPPPPQFVGISTSLVPSHPATKRIRMRLFRPALPEVQREVLLEPMRPRESVPANLAAALTLLRPMPLNVAAALSPLPNDSADSLRWWWRDPWLAAGSYVGWLVASLALAAFCAWRARRAARERCATVRAVRFWTAVVFLLGPVGLLWMRFVLPRVPVEAVGGARRAVNLDASPGTAAPWPDAKPLGIEVFS